VVADVSKTLDPPKSSFLRRTLKRLFPPWKGLLRGIRYNRRLFKHPLIYTRPRRASWAR